MILPLALGYLFGSVPFGLLLTRAAGLGDIRRVGSGNIGATNVLRTGRKELAAATLVLDAAKGAAAVLAAGALFGGTAVLWAGLGAVLGHSFPVWLRFRGGKGVATGLGVLLAAMPAVGGAACLVWAGMATLGRRSSVAALAAFAITPLVAWGLDGPRQAALALAIALLICARHHENIRRLLAGTEPKIGQAA